MSLPEIVMLLALVALPVGLGVWSARTGRPWWWGAAVASAVFVVAAVGPTPEAGESRVAVDDVLFLVVCCAAITAGTGVTSAVARQGRHSARRHDSGTTT